MVRLQNPGDFHLDVGAGSGKFLVAGQAGVFQAGEEVGNGVT